MSDMKQVEKLEVKLKLYLDDSKKDKNGKQEFETFVMKNRNTLEGVHQFEVQTSLTEVSDMCDIYGPGFLTFNEDSVTLRSLYKDGEKTWTYQQLQKATCNATNFQMFITDYSDWMYFEYVPGDEMKRIFDCKKLDSNNRRWFSIPKSQKVIEGINYLWKIIKEF